MSSNDLETSSVTLASLHNPGDPLPLLEAAAFNQILTNGGHHPLLFQMTDRGLPAGRWVLKPAFSMSASNRRAGLGVIAEIVGLVVCGWLGVSRASSLPSITATPWQAWTRRARQVTGSPARPSSRPR